MRTSTSIPARSSMLTCRLSPTFSHRWCWSAKHVLSSLFPEGPLSFASPQLMRPQLSLGCSNGTSLASHSNLLPLTSAPLPVVSIPFNRSTNLSIKYGVKPNLFTQRQSHPHLTTTTVTNHTPNTYIPSLVTILYVPLS